MIKKVSAFMKPEASLPCSQEPATGPCCEPHEYSPHSHHSFNIILPSTCQLTSSLAVTLLHCQLSHYCQAVSLLHHQLTLHFSIRNFTSLPTVTSHYYQHWYHCQPPRTSLSSVTLNICCHICIETRFRRVRICQEKKIAKRKYYLSEDGWMDVVG